MSIFLTTPSPDRKRDYGQLAWISLGLLSMILLVFAHSCRNGFLAMDDNLYVTENPAVKTGLSWPNICWAFSHFHAANWHPMTWVSLQLDAGLFGLKAWGFHLTNVLLHAANVLLLFHVLVRLTGAIWRSALVAALFGVHPLHVESVAWIAERKDVLSTLFWILTLGAYWRYVRNRCWRRYFLMLVLFALGLMSKPMLVTLPFTLLLLDYWPLHRFGEANTGASGPDGRPNPETFIPAAPSRLVLEKVPMFAMSAASCAVTFFAQKQGGTVQSWQDYPWEFRLGNALISYVTYLGKMFWPVHLAAFYPHLGTGLPWGQVVFAVAILTSVTILVVWLRRRYPYLLVGWFWYLGTLVPVIGVVQQGLQGMADRFTYVPMIGLFMAISWGLADIAGRWQVQKIALALAAMTLAFCMILSWIQVGYWRDTITVGKHNIDVSPTCVLAYLSLAKTYELLERPEEAYPYYLEAARLDPDDLATHFNLAILLENQGQPEEALNHYLEAARINPTFPTANFSAGKLLLAGGRVDEAIGHFQSAVKTDSPNEIAYFFLGRALARKEQWQEAEDCFRRASKFRFDWADQIKVRLGLAWVLHQQGKTAAAKEQFLEATRLDPRWPQLANQEAWILATHPDPRARDGAMALGLAQPLCLASDNKDPRFLDTLAAAYAELGRFDKAVQTAQEALGLTSSAKHRKELEKRLDLYRAGRSFHMTGD
jgi:tetratricopeptide (TPR) repeat protein